MQRIVDLHIHSHYSRATSSAMNIVNLYRWAKIKGIDVMGTGDYTHPAWFKELREKLEPAEEGLLRLKDEYAQVQDMQLPKHLRKKQVRFILSVEISCIYSKGGSVRKLHNIIVVPSFQTAASISTRLSQIGNLSADGRPILGLDSKELLKIALDANSDSLFIPAHIWTPHFALFGSNSGFDSMQDAFEELSPYIAGVETGLSSDPYMNWRLSELDNVTLVSNSDAHSPPKLGREANIIDCKLSYRDISEAIRTGDDRFIGTIEFYPEEGKYHYDGHRTCNIRFSPQETKKHKGLCPVCNRPVTMGVLYRVEQLADRPALHKSKQKKTVEYIIPLAEMIAHINNVKSTNSKKVQKQYVQLYEQFGDEFSILRTVPIEAIAEHGFEHIAQAIHMMRKGDVHIEPGYDGVYGVISVFASDSQKSSAAGQLSLYE